MKLGCPLLNHVDSHHEDDRLGQPSTSSSCTSHSGAAVLGKPEKDEFLFTVGIHTPFLQLLAPWSGLPSLDISLLDVGTLRCFSL